MGDRELLSAYLDDESQAAFAQLVERHMPLVFSSAVRQLGGDAHLAKDVVQAVFTALARKASALRNHQTVTGWLYTSTHLAVLHTLRTEARRRVHEQEALAVSLESAAKTDGAWDQLRPVMDEVLQELNHRDREAVLLRYYEGSTFSEIGLKLSLSENAARMRVERALDKMHGLLGRRGVTSTAVALALFLTEQAAIAAPSGLVAEITGIALAEARTAAPLAIGHGAVALKTKAFIGIGVAAVITTTVFLQWQGNEQLRTELEHRESQTRQAVTALATNHRVLQAWKAQIENLRKIERLGEKMGVGLQSDGGPVQDLEVLRARIQVFVAETYAALFRRLRLSPAQQEQFQHLLFEKSLTEVELVNYISFGGLQGIDLADRATVSALRSAATEQTEDQIRQLLGPANYGQYQNYAATLKERLQVENFAAQLTPARLPLSDAQLDQLVALLARLAPDPEAPLPDSFSGQAEAILDSNQVPALPKLVAALGARRAILTMNRAAVQRGLLHPAPVTGRSLLRE